MWWQLQDGRVINLAHVTDVDTLNGKQPSIRFWRSLSSHRPQPDNGAYYEDKFVSMDRRDDRWVELKRQLATSNPFS